MEKNPEPRENQGIYQGKRGEKEPNSSAAPRPAALLLLLLLPSALPTAVVVIIMIAAEGRGRGGVRTPRPSPHPPAAAGEGAALRCQRCRSPDAARGLRRETWRETPGRRDPEPRTHPHTQRESIPHRLLSEHLVQPQPMEIYAGHNREQDFVPSLPPPSPLFSLSLPPFPPSSPPSSLPTPPPPFPLTPPFPPQINNMDLHPPPISGTVLGPAA